MQMALTRPLHHSGFTEDNKPSTQWLHQLTQPTFSPEVPLTSLAVDVTGLLAREIQTISRLEALVTCKSQFIYSTIRINVQKTKVKSNLLILIGDFGMEKNQFFGPKPTHQNNYFSTCFSQCNIDLIAKSTSTGIIDAFLQLDSEVLSTRESNMNYKRI